MRTRINLKVGRVVSNHNEQITRDGSKARILKVKTGVKAGGMNMQHNQTVAGGLRIKSSIKAGGSEWQHNQTISRGLRLRSNVKAGGIQMQHNQTISGGLKIKSGIKAGASDGRSYVTGYFQLDLDGVR